MLAQLRIAWRMQRWELVFLIGGSVLLALAMTVVAWQLDVSRDAVIACYGVPNGAAISASCRSTIEWGNLLASAVGILGAAAIFAPFPIGIFLGAPLVAREIEHRTAPIAWSLSLSRRRWLAGRTLPLLVLIGVALIAVGQASELLLSSVEESELGFRHYGMFGPLIATRGLAVFAIGVVVGLVVGRVLPAVLVTALAAVALTAGLSIGRDLIMRAESVWVPMGDQSGEVHMVFDSGFRSDTTGEVITSEQAYNQYPNAFNEMGEGAPPDMTSVWRIVPPERFGLFVAREAAVLAVTIVAIGGLGVVLVGSRRPE
jgi:ABC-type transport system involved in multi-copper enzyme maturation permease subunit